MSYNIVQDYTEHKYIEHKFTLDCKKSQSQVSIPVRENDTAIKLFITLQDGREPFYIEDGCISAIFIKKSDGTICENACIIEDNRTIRYDFTEGTANVEGINDCEVRVYSADGTMLTSPRFIMVVTNRVLSDDKITKDERTIIDNILLSELGRVTAENSREEEETARRENEAKRVQAEGDREDTFSKKIDEINGKLAKGNLLVFDTKEHLNQFIGGYESTKNLCPLPKIKPHDYYTLTHNDNGTFNFDVSHDIGIPDCFGTVTLEPGVYVFTRYNCEFFIGITYDKMIPISKPFEVTETTEYELCSSGYAGDSFKNAWVQITKGESVPDEFIPYYAPYTREDGKTVNDLSPGDILLITEEGVSDYWWDGNAIRPIEAQADQTYSPGGDNAQSGKAVAEALSGYVVAEVGKGLSSNDFTNEDKEKLYSALQNENVDQTYIPNSENPQSGKAVAEAVATEQNRADNTFSNALKGSKSGSAILIDDVSPVAHEISVVLDVGGATVAKYGKNLAPSTFNFIDVPGLSITDNGDGSISIKGAVAQNCYSPLIKDFVLPRGTYCVSGIFPSDWVYSDGYALIDGNYIYTSTQVITLSERKTVTLNFVFIAGVQYDLVIRPQIEVGTTSTEWEKYKEPIIYTADESGNVSGIVGNGNDITLTTNDDVKISVKYNKDINKMFTKLTQAIISLGGNV